MSLPRRQPRVVRGILGFETGKFNELDNRNNYVVGTDSVDSLLDQDRSDEG